MPKRRSSVYDPIRDQIQPDSTTADAASEEAIRSPSSESQPKRKRESQDEGKVKSVSTDKTDEPATKRPKTSPVNTPTSSATEPKSITAASLSTLTKVKKKAPEGQQRPAPPRRRSPDPRRRSTSPDARNGRATPPRRSPRPIRDPTPPARSPPRQRKRPGAAARVNKSDVDEVRKRQEDREKVEQERENAEIVREKYNAVPQRGRQWRSTNSKIKGLRSFNNWIKSAVIQKFSPDESYVPAVREHDSDGAHRQAKGLMVLDLGCGKGGDLQKWKSAPQRVDLYVGFDPADVSISQAQDRYGEMKQQQRRGYRGHLFDAHFFVRDCFGEWLGHVPIIRDIGIDPTIGPDGHNGGQPRQGGFDVVTMMFSMHYAFESEEKARGMLKNVAGALKKGGRFLGVAPNSDIISSKAAEFARIGDKSTGYMNGTSPISSTSDEDMWDPESLTEDGLTNGHVEGHDDDGSGLSTPRSRSEQAKAEAKEEGEIESQLEWGNDIYRVKFNGKAPSNGVFRPNFGWKYSYFLEEAIDAIPEYVVPWEGFRYLASQYDLELQYRKPFGEVWAAERKDAELGPLAERMGVTERGRLLVSDEEMAAANFYHAFCFYKT